jgi:hypothetical protein
LLAVRGACDTTTVMAQRRKTTDIGTISDRGRRRGIRCS